MNLIIIDKERFAGKAAEIFAHSAEEAIEQDCCFFTALSGGNTPLPTYSIIAAEYTDKIPWENVRIFIGDERCVPPDHPDSNYRMINEVMLSKLPIPKENIYRIKGELSPQTAAEDYSKELARAFNLKPGEVPTFDLMMLGIGEDAHTASIFPGSPVIHESSLLAAAVYVPKLKSYRVTITPPVIQNSRRILVLASGIEKAEAVRHVLEGTEEPEKYPAQLVNSAFGDVIWLIDADAASLLPDRSKT